MRRASVIANPEALTLNHRYIDCGLNRSFRPSFLTPPTPDGPPEVQRARALLARWGWQGNQPWLPATQRRLGLPVHLHEGDPTQTGFPWPCGLVIKVGSVAQGVLDARIIRQTQLALKAALEGPLACRRGDPFPWPAHLEAHRRLGRLDVRRD